MESTPIKKNTVKNNPFDRDIHVMDNKMMLAEDYVKLNITSKLHKELFIKEMEKRVDMYSDISYYPKCDLFTASQESKRLVSEILKRENRVFLTKKEMG